MRLYVDLGLEKIIESSGVLSPKDRLNFKRSLGAVLEFQFLANGIVQELPPDATGIFGLKQTGRYDADDYVTAALTWVKSGTGENTVYTFYLALINTALDTLFHVDGNPLNDVEMIEVMAELQWITTGFVHKSQTVAVQIVNDVNRGGETMADMPSIAIGVYLPNITRLVGGTEIYLDAVPTVLLRLGYVIQLQIANLAAPGWGWRIFTLVDWPPGYVLLDSDVAPLDYDAGTNARYWRGASAVEIGESETLIEIVAAEDLDAFTLVTAGGITANSSNTAHIGHVVGMTREDVASGFIARLVTMGELVNPSWTWAANLKLYLNGAAISTTPPSSGFVQQIGVTRNSTTIILEFGPPVRL